MRYTPHEYQRFGENMIVQRDMLGLFWEMGLGKSVVTLSAILRLKYDLLQVYKVLVIAPKKVAEGTWNGEARKWDHLSPLRVQLVMGTAQQRIKALFTPGGRVRDQPRQCCMAGAILPERLAVRYGGGR